MAKQTRQRILDTALTMFNAQGEPNVTTNHIADELEISPGNLYYHFRNKDDIIEQLFARFEERMDAALSVPQGRLPGLEDIWQGHLALGTPKEVNTDEKMIANLEPTAQCTGNLLKLSVARNGDYTLTNARNNFSKTYKAK